MFSCFLFVFLIVQVNCHFQCWKLNRFNFELSWRQFPNRNETHLLRWRAFNQIKYLKKQQRETRTCRWGDVDFDTKQKANWPTHLLIYWWSTDLLVYWQKCKWKSTKDVNKTKKDGERAFDGALRNVVDVVQMDTQHATRKASKQCDNVLAHT